VVIPCDDRRRSIGDAPSGAQASSSSSDWGVSEMRRRARFGGGGLVCTGDASSVLAETLVGGSSRFLGERFVLLMRAARGGVGGFLLLVKKSVMERCCDICVTLSLPRFGKGAVYSFQRITSSTG